MGKRVNVYLTDERLAWLGPDPAKRLRELVDEAMDEEAEREAESIDPFDLGVGQCAAMPAEKQPAAESLVWPEAKIAAPVMYAGIELCPKCALLGKPGASCRVCVV